MHYLRDTVLSQSPSDLASVIAQECVSEAPVIILGSGASASYGIPGMPALRSHLLKTRPVGAASTDLAAWQQFLDRLSTVDLETALTEIHLPISMTRHVVESTWDFLVPHDLRLFDSVVRNKGILSLTRLYRHLFQSTHNKIDVITPNYDRLAEYAADAGEMCHYTGFGYGHLRLRAKNFEPRIHYGAAVARTACVWKVHGSFDWFKDQDGVVIALPISAARPAGLEPVMVTPGIEKYRLTHDEPFRSIQQGADSALQSARSYLCIGYGFNDAHIQTKLVERCRAESVPLVLITKEITPAAHDFLKAGKCQRYLALEECGAGSRMFSIEYPGGVEISDKPIWRLDQFLTMVMP